MSRRMVVVLPEPFGPRNPITSPASTRRLRLVDRELVAEPLGEAFRLDHGAAARRGATLGRGRPRSGVERARGRARLRRHSACRASSASARALGAPQRGHHLDGAGAPFVADGHAEARAPPRRPVEPAPERPRVLGREQSTAQRGCAHVDGARDPALSVVSRRTSSGSSPREARERRRRRRRPPGSRAANSASRRSPARARDRFAQRTASRISMPSSVTRDSRAQQLVRRSTSSISFTSSSSPSDGMPSPSAGPNDSSGLGWKPTE